MIKRGAPVIGIRPGRKPVEFVDANEAAVAAEVEPKTVYQRIQDGKQTKTGWCFDYKLEGI
jgi:hypothetical protein